MPLPAAPGDQRLLPQGGLSAAPAVKFQRLLLGIGCHLHTGSPPGNAHLLDGKAELFVGLFVRLKGEHPLAAARKMQQLGDGVAAVGAKVGKMFVVCGPQDVLIGLLHRRLAVKEVVQLAAELKLTMLCSTFLDCSSANIDSTLANSCSYWRTKSRVKRLIPPPHIRRHQLYLLGEGADTLDGRQVPHRKGHDDDKIVVARLDVPQFFHPVPHKEVAARKIVAWQTAPPGGCRTVPSPAKS